ncbi:MAG: hypothetical protein KDD38_07310 [Bdellovibrionales bacterium]|nr:hypothetical protein [Bdellovibrionales bacterium]
MKKFGRFILGGVTLAVMSGAVLFINACGPEQDIAARIDDERRADNAKEKARLDPLAGHYEGDMLSFAGNGTKIRMQLDLSVYSAPRSGAGGGIGSGEENTKPMIRAYLSKVPVRDQGGEVPNPLPPLSYWQSNYNESTGELALFNTATNGNVYGGIQAVYRRWPTGEETIEGNLSTISGNTTFLFKKINERQK